MAEIIKVSIFGVVGVLLAIQFKNGHQEYSVYIGSGLALLIFGYGLRQIGSVIDRMGVLYQYLGDTAGFLSVLLKVIGITYICEFSAGICKDAGYSAVSEQIEILGKLSVMFAGLPILFAVIEQIQGFL